MNTNENISKKALQSESKKTSTVTKLGWVSFFNDCSSEAIARALPLLLPASPGMSPTFVGIIEGVAEAISIFLKGFSGWVSDKMPSNLGQITPYSNAYLGYSWFVWNT